MQRYIYYLDHSHKKLYLQKTMTMKTKLYFLIILLISATNIHAQTPSWSWAKSFGSTGDEMAPCSALDHKGNLYVLGHHTAPSLTFDSTTIYNFSSNTNNVYLVKYNPSGELIFAKSLNVDINPARIIIDKENNLLAVAYFMETLVIDNITVHKTSEGGNNGSDLVLIKFDTTGTALWASNGFGSNSFDRFSGVALDDSSNIYVGGAFDGTSLIFNNDTIYNSGGNDVFLLKFNSTGAQIWARGVNGSLEEIGGGICVDKNDFIYNTGTYTSQFINFEDSTTLSNHENSLQSRSIFFTKHAPSGALIWAKRIGGTKNEDNPFIKTDSDNNIYITGTSESQQINYESINFPNNDWNAFVVKLNSQGWFLWGKTSTGNGYKAIKDVAIDTIGNTYICGYFFDQYTFGVDSFINYDNPEIFLTKISSTGNATWSKIISGNLFEIPENISLHPNGSIYISGSFQSDTLFLDAHHLTNNSNVSYYSDIFIAHTSSVFLSSNSPLCDGSNLQLSISTIPEASYSWSGPNNFTSSEQNPILENCNTTMSGNYSVHVITPGLPDFYDTIHVQIFPIPESPTATNGGTVCAGNSTSLNATSIDSATYYWTNTFGFSMTGQNITITPDTSGYYFLHVEVNGCPSQFDSTYIIVKEIPNSPTLHGYERVCIGSPITLYADTISGASYQWEGPDNFSSSIQNPLVCSKANISKSGYYYATATVDGCTSSSDSIEIIVNPPMSSPNICIVSFDNNSHKNKIIWEKETSTAIVQYNLYKEKSILNQYELIASIPYDSSCVYTDLTSNPLEGIFKYRITSIDTCENETVFSNPHQTIHLSISEGISNTFNLYWNNYDGTQILSYNIYRGSSSDSLVLLTTVPSTTNTFTDFSFNDDLVYYQIEMIGDNNCTPSILIPSNVSKSNIASNDQSYVLANELINLYPIPADNYIRISAPTNTTGQIAQIYSIDGILILTQHFGMNDNFIDVSSLNSGIYFIKIIQDNRVITNTFIKN